MSDLFANVFQLLSFISEDPELQVPLQGLAHISIQEREFVFCHELNLIFLFVGRGVRSVYPYFRGEF